MLAQPVEVHLERGERRTELVVHLAGDARLLLLADRLQMPREGAQLFARTLDLELRKTRLRIVEHQSIPDDPAVEFARSRADVDPLFVGFVGR